MKKFINLEYFWVDSEGSFRSKFEKIEKDENDQITLEDVPKLTIDGKLCGFAKTGYNVVLVPNNIYDLRSLNKHDLRVSNNMYEHVFVNCSTFFLHDIEPFEKHHEESEQTELKHRAVLEPTPINFSVTRKNVSWVVSHLNHFNDQQASDVSMSTVATVHCLNVDICEGTKSKMDLGQHEKENFKNFNSEFEVKATEWLSKKYPSLVEKAKHGDVIQDNTAGYRCNGVYFVQTKPEFRVINMGTGIDMYGNLPKQFKLITEFEPSFWDMERMNSYNHDDQKEGSIDFYWHGCDGVWGYLDPALNDNFRQTDENKGEITWNGKVYEIKNNCEDGTMPTVVYSSDISLKKERPLLDNIELFRKKRAHSEI